MTQKTEEIQISGVDYATFMGVILAVTGVVMVIAIALTGSVPDLSMGGLAVAGATVAIFGHAMIAKGMGYRAIFSAIKRYPGVWLFTIGMGIGGGLIMIGTASALLKVTS